MVVADVPLSVDETDDGSSERGGIALVVAPLGR